MASEIGKNYLIVLQGLKEKIRQARLRAVLFVNNELLIVYWEIGNTILEQQQQEGWGAKVIDRLATDLKIEFPDMKGFSLRNLKYMRAFAEAYPEFVQPPAALIKSTNNQEITIVHQLAAQLPWGHHQLLLDKTKTPQERGFYIQKAVENGWSRNILAHQIESSLHKTQGALVNNFSNTMPAYQSELTAQVFKDPYHFDFIMLSEKAKERDLESALMTHVTKVLLELGVGFAFVARQKKFEAGGRDFFVDLLFYHTKLRRYIIIELKIGEFEPEYVSKMNLYLGLADDQLKSEYDEPAIGLILCKTNNKIVAEYALRDTSKPIGIAEYKIAERLPDDIKGDLPSIEEIESHVEVEIKENQKPHETKWSALKKKLVELNKSEIKTPFSFETYQKLLFNSLCPMYEHLMQNTMNHFAEEFMKVEFLWSMGGVETNSIAQLKTHFEDKQNWNNQRELNFICALNGLKKAGTDSINIWFHLNLELQEYWYGFKSSVQNRNEVFIKKLYHDNLTEQDIITLEEIHMNYVIGRIEDYLKQNDNSALE